MVSSLHPSRPVLDNHKFPKYQLICSGQLIPMLTLYTVPIPYLLPINIFNFSFYSSVAFNNARVLKVMYSACVNFQRAFSKHFLSLLHLHSFTAFQQATTFTLTHTQPLLIPGNFKLHALPLLLLLLVYSNTRVIFA